VSYYARLNMPISLASGFGTADWLIIGIYLLVLLASGIYFARREPAGSDEYFLAGRRMPTWAVAFSIVASTLSVATFVGVPEQTFKDGGNLTYLSTNIGGLIAIFVVAYFFIPAYFKYNVTTVYELLERRFGRGAKEAASATFMLGRVFASGARVYIGAIPIATLLFGIENALSPPHLIGAIAVLSAVAILYTLVGGIASVIWTDVLQTIVLLGAITAGIVLMYNRIPAPLGEIVQTLHTQPGGSKFTVLNWGFPFDPSQQFTLLTAVLGWSLLNLAAYGTDHDMAQRMLTCKNAVSGGRSAIAAICMGIPIVAMFLLVGLLLFVIYKVPELMGSAVPAVLPETNDKALLTFIINEFPTGLSGLMVAGLFAVALGSLNSAINAMAATFVKDFYIPYNRAKPESHYLAVSRWAVAGWGVILGVFGVVCIYWKRSNPDTTLLDFALGVMTFCYSGLLAVFLTAMFTRRGNTASAIAALITGFVVVVAFQPIVYQAFAPLIPGAPATGHTVATLKEQLPHLRLAYPWHMLIGTSIAMIVCLAGKPKASAASRPAAA